MKTAIPATISKAMTLADSTVRIQVDLQEQPPEVMSEMFALKGKIGFFFFHEQPITEIDIKNLPEIKIEKWEKPHSARLRACLFRLWEQTPSSESFEIFYKDRMEQIINMIKDKLN